MEHPRTHDGKPIYEKLSGTSDRKSTSRPGSSDHRGTLRLPRGHPRPDFSIRPPTRCKTTLIRVFDAGDATPQLSRDGNASPDGRPQHPRS
jgi:hypothetical protein